MKKRILLLLCLILTAMPLPSFAKTAEEWIHHVDLNMNYMTAEYTSTMTVHHPNGQERVYRMQGKVQGDDYALMEFLEPPRDRGTRYLKREKNLWIYFPRQDRTLQIQGHMLRECVQGSDLSYEDLTESSQLIEKYTSLIVSETDSTVTIRLEAKEMTVSYPFQLLQIDKTSGIPLKIVYSGVGNTPIKEMEILQTQRIGKRLFPVVMEIRSLLVENKWTRLEFEDIEFGMEFPLDTFTKEGLER